MTWFLHAASSCPRDELKAAVYSPRRASNADSESLLLKRDRVRDRRALVQMILWSAAESHKDG